MPDEAQQQPQKETELEQKYQSSTKQISTTSQDEPHATKNTRLSPFWWARGMSPIGWIATIAGICCIVLGTISDLFFFNSSPKWLLWLIVILGAVALICVYVTEIKPNKNQDENKRKDDDNVRE